MDAALEKLVTAGVVKAHDAIEKALDKEASRSSSRRARR